MNCPVCQVELKLADRQGIEIDYCPQCRGVWLDRGELDKLIERQATVAARPIPPSREMPYARPGEHRPYEWDDDDHYRGGYRGRKRRGWLDDLFDFD